MLPDYKTQADFQRQIINQRRKEREMQKEKKEEDKLQQEEEQLETIAAEEQENEELSIQANPDGEEVDVLDDDFSDEGQDLRSARRPRMSRTERFGMTVLLALFGLVGILALDVAGVPIIRKAKRTVVKMISPNKASSDPFKGPGESESGGYEDNVIVIPRGD